MNILYAFGGDNMSKNMKIFWVCIVAFLLLCWGVSCSLDNSSDSDYEPYEYDYEITEQDIDNLEFLYEMEEKWNSQR